MTFKQVAVLAAVLFGAALVFKAERAAASDRYTQTVTSTGSSASSYALTAGGRYAVQCDAAARIITGDKVALAKYAHLLADGGDAGVTSDVYDGGPAFGPTATTNSMLVAAGAIYDIDLGSNERYISVISVSGTANCRVYFRNVPSSQ